MTHIPVYELHDGRAYDAFIKTTRASIKPTRAGIYSNIETTTLRRVTGNYTRLDVPANANKLDPDTLRAIVTTEYPYQGQSLPLYNLSTKAWRIANELGICK